MTQVEMTHGEWLKMQKKNKVKKFRDCGCLISMASYANAVMTILEVAKVHCNDDDIAQRYDVAIASIGMHYLEEVEKSYEPVKKTYRVHLKGERIIEVMASSEEEAEQMVCQGDEILECERTDEVEEEVEQ